MTVPTPSSIQPLKISKKRQNCMFPWSPRHTSVPHIHSITTPCLISETFPPGHMGPHWEAGTPKEPFIPSTQCSFLSPSPPFLTSETLLLSPPEPTVRYHRGPLYAHSLLWNVFLTWGHCFPAEVSGGGRFAVHVPCATTGLGWSRFPPWCSMPFLDDFPFL